MNPIVVPYNRHADLLSPSLPEMEAVVMPGDAHHGPLARARVRQSFGLAFLCGSVLMHGGVEAV